MIRKSILPSIAIALFTLQSVQAQDLSCGTTFEDNTAIKAQMMENRQNISRAEIDFQRSKRSITYIPVTVHLVGNADSTSAPSLQSAINTICNLNTYFLEMGIQYYFHPTRPINHLYNSVVFNDGYANSSMGIMAMNKTQNALNIFIGDKVSSPVAGYYSRNGDFVFIRKSEATITSKTLPHEIGHFFTLPHTFYGWENTNYDQTYNGANAPQRINNRSVEYKARTGANANCATAADGFCDTEADYYAYRVQCNHNSVVLDPTGERLTPNPHNYMSYFADACLNEFSNEQQDAIWASIRQRNWLNFPAPSAINTADTAFLLAPIANENLVYTAFEGNALNFQWLSQPNAIGYIFRIERLLMGQSLGYMEDVWIPASSSDTLRHAFVLPRGGDFRWTVVVVSPSACETLSKNNTFKAEYVIGVEEAPSATTEDKNHQIALMPNPVAQGERIVANISTPFDVRANVRIISVDGRLAWQQKIDLFAQEDNFIHFDSQYFAAGMYILQVQSEAGTSNSKLIIR